MRIKEKGFAAVEGLLIFVAVASIVGVGIYVSRTNKEPAADSVSVSTPQPEENASQPAQSQKKYLEIEEHGVKFELNGDIADAYYSRSKEGYIYFSTHYFDNLEGFEYCKADPDKELGGLGLFALIDARVGEDNGFGDVWTEESLKSANAVKVDDTYYFFMKGNGGACFDIDKYKEDSAEFQKWEKIMQGFVQQQKTITKI